MFCSEENVFVFVFVCEGGMYLCVHVSVVYRWYTQMWVHAHMCACIHAEAKVLSLIVVIFCFLKDLFLNPEIKESTRLAANELQGCPCLCIPSTGIRDGTFTWELGISTQILVLLSTLPTK